MADDLPQRIVVELMSSADVKRLEGSDEALRAEIKRVEDKVDGLHRTLYELLEAFGQFKSKH